MTTYAYAPAGKVVELIAIATTPLASLYAAAFVAQCYPVPGGQVGTVAVGWTVTGSTSAPVFTAPAAPSGPSLAAQAVAAMFQGISIQSLSTPALDGLYACDPTTQAQVTAEVAYIAHNEAFSGGLSALPWPLMSGGFVSFPSTTEFLAFATAAADYVTHLNLVINGAPGFAALPNSNVTIA